MKQSYTMHKSFNRTALAIAVAAGVLSTSNIAVAADEGKLEEVVVTGSRILQRDGMNTPTPVSVLNADELSAMSPGNLIEGISQMPQFFGNQGLNTGGSWFTNAGTGNLNLRGLGVGRTLTLLNGRRMSSSTAFGSVDINAFPEAMIKNVETVTGGASAQYGTDAVAGVVNFILDTDFDGFEVKAQTGQTSRSDGETSEYSIVWGTDIGDKGHFQVSYEKAQQDPIVNFKGRDWYKGYGTITLGGEFQVLPNIISTAGSFNGLIFAPGTPLFNQEFTRDGQGLVPFVKSDMSTAFPVGVPPSQQSNMNGGSGDDFNSEYAGYGLMPDHEREALFVYTDYDVSDNLKVYAQYIDSSSDTFQYNTPSGSLLGMPTTATIFADNAFLPDSVRQTMADNNIGQFVIRKMGTIADWASETWINTLNDSEATTLGFDWRVESDGFFNDWVVKGSYQKGENERHGYQKGLRVDRLFAALDAVDDGNGNIVCRTSLFGDAFPGCQPLNIFGQGNASAAAIDYVTGLDAGQQITTPIYFADSGFDLGRQYSYTTGEAKAYITMMDQELIDISASGLLAEGWAGPIDIAVGYTSRKDEILQLVQDASNPTSDHSGAFKPVRCNDPSIGLRGVSAPDCGNSVGTQYSKVSNIMGEISNDEYFVELNIPLLSGGDAIDSMVLNTAARFADYELSGGIWAYKAGLDVQFNDSFRLRSTLSRDVRAPNLSELYDKTGGIGQVTDPVTGYSGGVTVFSGGNPNLDPEEADTITVGLVYTSQSIEGLSASLDWYEVDINEAIGQKTAQGMLDACELEGDQEACSYITRGADQSLILVGYPYINVDNEYVSGVDMELSYITDVNWIGGAAESFRGRVFVSHLAERSTVNAGSARIDNAGQTGIQTTGTAYALPEWKWTAQLTYNYGDFTAFLQGRYIGEGVNDARPSSPFSKKDNKVDSVFYTDLNLRYTTEMENGSTFEVFGNVTNLTDEAPPITPYYSVFSGATDQVNELLFDQLGRRYTVGVKYSF